MGRESITEEERQKAIEDLNDYLELKVIQKGDLSFASTHEILGILAEEYKEFIDAIQSNDKVSIRSELMDIGVVVLFGLACINENKLDW